MNIPKQDIEENKDDIVPPNLTGIGGPGDSDDENDNVGFTDVDTPEIGARPENFARDEAEIEREIDLTRPYVEDMSDDAIAELVKVVDMMNGDIFLPNDEGEADVTTHEYVVTILVDRRGNAVADTVQLLHMAAMIEKQIPRASSREKTIVLACRFYAYQNKLLKPKDKASKHRCRYKEVFLEEHKGQKYRRYDWIDAKLFHEMKSQFTNIVCFTAYVFRSRGHHFKDTFQADIHSKWQKNTNAEALNFSPGEHKYYLTYGLHAIYPDDLDGFWSKSIDNGTCCRPFGLRFLCPAAGTAPYFAILAGVNEAVSIFPKLGVIHAEAIRRIRLVCNDLVTKRWKGGINRKFYGGEKLNVKESDFASLAAAIYGTNTAEDHVTQLGKSRSLARVAGNAPLATEYARAMTTAVYDYLQSAKFGDRAAEGMLDIVSVGEGKTEGTT